MIAFGITGGIGSGKSVVCSLLAAKGVQIIAADSLAKRLTATSARIRAALTDAFGAEVYTAAGLLNKDRMRELVFNDSGARRRINEIIHPHVIDWIAAEIKRLQQDDGHRLVGVEAALIYESGMERILDKVVVVEAPVGMRVQWVQTRDDLSLAAVQQRISTQMPNSEKTGRADFVLDNSGDLAALERRVDELYSWLLDATPGP